MYAIGQKIDETLTAWAERVLDETKDDSSLGARVLRLEAKGVLVGAHVVKSAEGLDRIEGSPVPAADPETAARVSYEKDKTIAALQDEIRDLQAQLATMTQQRNDLQDKLAGSSTETQTSGS